MNHIILPSKLHVSVLNVTRYDFHYKNFYFNRHSFHIFLSETQLLSIQWSDALFYTFTADKNSPKIFSEQWHDLKQINSPHTIHLYAMIPKISLNLPDNAFNILASTIAWKWFSKWWEIPHLPPNYSPIQAIWESSPQVVWNVFFFMITWYLSFFIFFIFFSPYYAWNLILPHSRQFFYKTRISASFKIFKSLKWRHCNGLLSQYITLSHYLSEEVLWHDVLTH